MNLSLFQLTTVSKWVQNLPPIEQHYAQVFWSGIICGSVIGWLFANRNKGGDNGKTS